MASGDVRQQIEALRRKLLDLSLRNRMLNYRPSRRLGLTILGENSFEVHRLLVAEGRKMSFVGKKDPPAQGKLHPELPGVDDEVALHKARADAEEELSAFLENPAMPVDQMDTKLNVDELESVLQAKLRTIGREARLANDELGISTLFLTLGQLEWRETEDRSFRAPLLFVPVTLETLQNGNVKLLHAGGDVGENLPLRAKLAEFNLNLPAFDDDDSLLQYFNEVDSTIRARHDWAVHPNEVCLGFFNYEKYAIYVDLGGDLWPEGRKPWEHEDVSAMVSGGYSAANSPIDEQTFVDDVRPVAECHEVYDADSSQTLAMIRAASGLSIVIEGPPGTGKSQTITNIIAEAVAAGKTVLFVSAKRAALDVVKRRLTEANLGDMCLDLHDKLTNRREFYQEIKRTWSRTVRVRDEEERVARLTELRDKLNAHSRAINEPLLPFGTTPFTAMSQLARLPNETPEDRDGRVPFLGLPESEVRAVLPLVRALQARLSAGVPVRNPFWGCGIEHLDPAKRLDLEQDLSSATAAFVIADTDLAKASSLFRIEAPTTFEDVQVLRVCAERALSAPALDGVALKTATWQAEEPKVREAIATLRLRARIRGERGNEVVAGIWAADLSAISQAYEQHGEQWYGFLFGAYRDAKRSLSGYLSEAGPKEAIAQRNLIRDMFRAQESEAKIEGLTPVMTRLFGVQWQGVETDPDVLERLLAWVLELYAGVGKGEIPPGLLDFFYGSVYEDQTLLGTVDVAQKSVELAIDGYRKAADDLGFDNTQCSSEPLAVLRNRLQSWRDSLDRLQEYIGLNRARREALEKGLDAVVQVADHWTLASERLEDAYLRSYYTGVVREAMAQRPDLRSFEREGHEEAIAEFQSLDDFKLRYNRARVQLAHTQGLPAFETALGNLRMLKNQCELTRGHKPIRWTMTRAGEAVQRIKPVFMMSPLSVAIHLPPEMPPFDLVVFDEASQIKPEDALSAVMRARQVVVTGDTRQMPPTSFFDRIVADEDEEFEDEVDPALGKFESLLLLMRSAVTSKTRQPDLRWHYRSLHPALIQPSNELFYENRLVVFPVASSLLEGSRLGLVFHHDPTTIYEPGSRKRINRKEAEQVADEVVRHLRENPEESLMVAAMNKPQADLIYEEVSKRERTAPDIFAAFKAKHPHEPLDVKNLENVQGDERDVVYLSVTYGRDENGVIRQQFGPLLQSGGERRLNVLVSRARKRCEVFSNVTADDLRADASSLGVATLKRYLKFVESGSLEVAISVGSEESVFEEEVVDELRRLGYEVDTQVGTEGYRIDLAVRGSAGYLLGVECDGATYHSARSARDRDKLRQRVLEKRGWRLHRIWSSDWWQDREGEIQRLVEAISFARTEPFSTDLQSAASESYAVEEPRQETPTSLIAYRRSPLIGSLPTDEYLLNVIRHEGPIGRQMLVIRLKSAQPRSRRNVEGVLDELLSRAIASGQVMEVGDAFYTEDAQLATPRDWSSLPATERKIELVTDVEIQATLRLVVSQAFGIEREAAVKSAFSLLGFRRVMEDGLLRGYDAIGALLADGVLKGQNGHLLVTEDPD